MKDRLKSITLTTLVVPLGGGVVVSEAMSLPAADNAWIFAATVTIAGTSAIDHDEVAVQGSMDGVIWTDLLVFTAMGALVDVTNYAKILAGTAQAMRANAASVTVGNVQHMVLPKVRLRVDGDTGSAGTMRLDVCAI